MANCFVCGKFAQSRTNDGTWLCKDCVKKLGGFWGWNRICKMKEDEIKEVVNLKEPPETDKTKQGSKSAFEKDFLYAIAIFIFSGVQTVINWAPEYMRLIIFVLGITIPSLKLIVVLIFGDAEKLNKRTKSNRETISTDQMTGIQFERYCGMLLKEKYGFLKVEYTKVSGDFGGDLIAYDVNGKKWVVQCKRYSKNVGVEAVQEVLGAYMMYSADRMAVMTTSRLTDSARLLANKSGVKLIENIHGKVEIN